MPLNKCFGPLIAYLGPFAPAAVITIINAIYVYVLKGDLLVAVLIQLASMLILVLFMDTISEEIAKRAKCNTNGGYMCISDSK